MIQRPFNGLWSGTTQVGRYQKKHSPTHTHPDHRASFITFLYLQRSMASSLFNLCAWQSSRTTSFQVFFGLPLGLEPSTSCSIPCFTQSSSSFRNTWPYQRSLFCCNTNAMSSTPSLSKIHTTSARLHKKAAGARLRDERCLLSACRVSEDIRGRIEKVPLPGDPRLHQIMFHGPTRVRTPNGS